MGNLEVSEGISDNSMSEGIKRGWRFNLGGEPNEGLMKSWENKETKVFQFKGMDVGDDVDDENVSLFITDFDEFYAEEEEDEEDEGEASSEKKERGSDIRISDVIPQTPSVKLPKDQERFFEMKPEKLTVKNEFENVSGGPIHNLIFFPDLNIMASHTQNIRFWKVKGSKITHLPERLISVSDACTHFIKWNEHSFIYCTGGGRIFAYSVREKKLVKRFENSQCGVSRLLRLCEDNFLSVNREGMITMYAYSDENKSRTLKTFLGKKVPTDVRMIRSKQYPGHVFFNFINLEWKEHNYGVMLVDLRNDEIVMKFEGHETITDLESLISSTGDEILIIGSVKYGVYLQKTTKSGTVRYIRQVKENGHPTALFCYFNRFILVGSSSGHLNLYDVKKNYQDRDLDMRVHGNRINDIKFYFYYEKKKLRVVKKRGKKSGGGGGGGGGGGEIKHVTFFTASSDGFIKAVECGLVEAKEKFGEYENL